MTSTFRHTHGAPLGVWIPAGADIKVQEISNSAFNIYYYRGPAPKPAFVLPMDDAVVAWVGSNLNSEVVWC